MCNISYFISFYIALLSSKSSHVEENQIKYSSKYFGHPVDCKPLIIKILTLVDVHGNGKLYLTQFALFHFMKFYVFYYCYDVT